MNIQFTKRFAKQLGKLSPKLQAQWYERLAMFRIDPFSPALRNHSVHPTYPAARSINVTGDYRALYIETPDAVVFILIGTHSELY